MPAYGGYSPYPMRFGGAPGGKSLVQHVTESLLTQRGTAYSASTTSAVYVECLAYARALVFFGYETNARLRNQFFARSMTADGLLPRWERIYQLAPAPGATEGQRRASVAAKRLATGQTGSAQPIQDALQVALGPVFAAYEHLKLSEAVSLWPGGTTSPTIPWYSTLAHVLVRVQIPATYSLGRFYVAVGNVQPILDPMLPATFTWDWYVASSHGGRGFYLDEPDLDLEAFDI